MNDEIFKLLQQKYNMKFQLILVLILWIPFKTFACEFNTDCDPGSKCQKYNQYSLYGVCVGGLNPGNKGDRKPVRDSLDRNSKVGSQCSFNTDCDIGHKCMKEAGQLYGTCM